eukprot:TRINITY_DN3366_c1_g1_i4.p1 TRINITY_DN3366_c1_g1~~TRINITY_DN3366_c1_g1_i4.p1  ORF type:complete len:108 (+),score=28.26 TRINITY_DN3366_c1_g1_i4:25-324(+)
MKIPLLSNRQCLPWNQQSFVPFLSRPFSKTLEPQSVKKFDPRLLDVLGCPFTKTRLQYDENKQELRSIVEGQTIAFQIRNGIPILDPREGRIIDEVRTK